MTPDREVPECVIGGGEELKAILRSTLRLNFVGLLFDTAAIMMLKDGLEDTNISLHHCKLKRGGADCLKASVPVSRRLRKLKLSVIDAELCRVWRDTLWGDATVLSRTQAYGVNSDLSQTLVSCSKSVQLDGVDGDDDPYAMAHIAVGIRQAYKLKKFSIAFENYSKRDLELLFGALGKAISDNKLRDLSLESYENRLGLNEKKLSSWSNLHKLKLRCDVDEECLQGLVTLARSSSTLSVVDLDRRHRFNGSRLSRKLRYEVACNLVGLSSIDLRKVEMKAVVGALSRTEEITKSDTRTSVAYSVVRRCAHVVVAWLIDNPH